MMTFILCKNMNQNSIHLCCIVINSDINMGGANYIQLNVHIWIINNIAMNNKNLLWHLQKADTSTLKIVNFYK